VLPCRQTTGIFLLLTALVFSTLPYCFGESEAVARFRKEWEEAKDFPPNQKEAIEKLSREMTVEAAKVIAEVAFRDDASYEASQAAFDALVRMYTTKIVKWMSGEVHSNTNWRVRAVMARVLARQGDADATDGLIKALGDKKWEVRFAVAKALGRMPVSRRIIDVLVQQMQKEEGRLIYEFANILGEITGAKGITKAADWKNWWDANKDTWAPPSELGGPDRPGTANPKDSFKTDPGSPIYGRIKTKKVIFVVDVSESMRTEGAWGEGKKKMSRLDIVKKELCHVIEHQLDQKCKFNIITFSEKVKPWKKKPVKATKGAKSSAKSFIKKLKAKGVTYTYGALKEAFDNEDIDTIYFLSDGEPTHPPNSQEIDRDYIIGKVKALNRYKNRKINTIAFMVGDAKDFGFGEDKAKCAAFMETLAKATGGNFRKIE